MNLKNLKSKITILLILILSTMPTHAIESNIVFTYVLPNAKIELNPKIITGESALVVVHATQYFNSTGLSIEGLNNSIILAKMLGSRIVYYEAEWSSATSEPSNPYYWHNMRTFGHKLYREMYPDYIVDSYYGTPYDLGEYGTPIFSDLPPLSYKANKIFLAGGLWDSCLLRAAIDILKVGWADKASSSENLEMIFLTDGIYLNFTLDDKGEIPDLILTDKQKSNLLTMKELDLSNLDLYRFIRLVGGLKNYSLFKDYVDFLVEGNVLPNYSIKIVFPQDWVETPGEHEFWYRKVSDVSAPVLTIRFTSSRHELGRIIPLLKKDGYPKINYKDVSGKISSDQ